ncbi:uncharacterized protein LOC122703131 [Cervus elaphus]|uniref:uncharacterized protein LOC122703131 n=1 Tax=Cervus elaphus TaxID=9860 RepID=UPI001CC27B8A|nr:uncharacterized protein LOC122703131 [Cervus elaphus]
MLVDQGAHPELLFGGVDEEPDKDHREDDEWRESGESGRRKRGPRPGAASARRTWRSALRSRNAEGGVSAGNCGFPLEPSELRPDARAGRRGRRAARVTLAAPGLGRRFLCGVPPSTPGGRGISEGAKARGGEQAPKHLGSAGGRREGRGDWLGSKAARWRPCTRRPAPPDLQIRAVCGNPAARRLRLAHAPSSHAASRPREAPLNPDPNLGTDLSLTSASAPPAVSEPHTAASRPGRRLHRAGVGTRFPEQGRAFGPLSGFCEDHHLGYSPEVKHEIYLAGELPISSDLQKKCPVLSESLECQNPKKTGATCLGPLKSSHPYSMPKEHAGRNGADLQRYLTQKHSC